MIEVKVPSITSNEDTVSLIEILIDKAELTFKKLQPKQKIKDVSVVGGVAANKSIRKSLSALS